MGEEIQNFMDKVDQFRMAINQKLVETGETVRLKELLRSRLIESGWREEVKAYCKEKIKERGSENVTVDELVNEITPKAREMVPDSVKLELLQQIKAFLSQQGIEI